MEGQRSLEVKGDLAEKVSGALGIKVDGDIKSWRGGSRMGPEGGRPVRGDTLWRRGYMGPGR